MKFLLDMNLPRELAHRLILAGHQCRHVADIGLSRAEDLEIVAAAREAREVILTHDLDYGGLLAFSEAGEPSVVIFRTRDVSVQNLASRLLGLMPRIEHALSDGAVVVISDEAARVRRLPRGSR